MQQPYFLFCMINLTLGMECFIFQPNYSYPLLITVRIILNRPFGFIKFGVCAGIIIPWPDSSTLETLSMTISALPSMIWAKVSKGDVFSVNPSPLSNDMTLIFPVDFLIIVLITTEFAIYSIISTMMCALDFSISKFAGFPLPSALLFFIILSMGFIMLNLLSFYF